MDLFDINGLPAGPSVSSAPEFSLGGDYYRVASSNPSQFWGGAGSQHAYDYYKDMDPTEARNWVIQNPGEHDEQGTYFWAGLNTPQYVSALQKDEAERSALEKARLSNPGAIGQAVTRSESSLTGGGNEDDWRQELAFYSHVPAIVSALSQYYTPEMQQQIQQQINASTPSAQSARAEEDDGFGDIMKLAMLAAAIYSGGSALGAWGGLGEGAALTSSGLESLASQWAALEGTPTLVMGGDLAAGGLGAFASEAGFGGLGAAATGLGTGFGPNGDLTLEQFLTSPDSVTGLEGFGGSQGIPAMDTLGSTSWLESAANSLKHGDTSWLTSSISPTQTKSVLSKAFGGGSAPTRTGATKTAAGAGGMGGINIFNTGGDESGLADAMKIFSGGRSGMDSVVQAMSQSGKGN